MVLLLVGLLYNAFVFAYMPAAGIAFSSPTSMMFHAFVFLSLSSFLQAARTDPGGVPNTKEWRTFGKPPPQTRQKKRGKDEARWCRKSEAYKPDRAHYSNHLQRPVLKFDHHCPWVGNTMGFRNYKFFVLFLLYSGAACAMFNVNIIQLLVHATLSASDTFLLLGAEGLTMILTTILGPFLMFHLWLVSKDVTTFEFWMSPEEEGFPYDKGLYSNICASMGDNPLLWLFPVGGPSGDGLSFVKSGESQADAATHAPKGRGVVGRVSRCH
jgi:hypothetical protein